MGAFLIRSMRVAVVLAVLAVVVACASGEKRRLGRGYPRALRELLNNEDTRAKLCATTGFGCEVPDTSKTVAAFKARHGEVNASTLQPVILVPGLGGSGLNAAIDKDYQPAWNCFKHWERPWGIWVQLYEILAQKCWFDNLRIYYDAATDTYHDSPGVNITVRDFGGLGGIDYLDNFDDPLGLTAYYAPISDALRGIGYVENVTLFGAPYDWRVAVDHLMENDVLGTQQTYHEDLKQLVERAYESAGQQPVHLVTHSMGGPTILYFLNHVTEAWKDKYVATFVPIAGPFAGTVKALKAQLSGAELVQLPLDISILNKQDIARVMRGSGGAAYLGPDFDYYGSQVFVSTPSRNYTAAEFGDMWTAVGAHNASVLWNRTKDLISDLVHPNVKSYCLYGYGVKTDIHLTYTEEWPADPNDVIEPISDESDLGDGTVPLFSLVECKNWESVEPKPLQVNCRTYNLTGHAAVLKDAALHLDLLEIVTGTSDIVGCADTPEYLQAVQETEKYRR